MEFRESPDQEDDELLERWAKMQSPRAFKTHAFPGPGPGPHIEFNPKAKYLVVLRNPIEVRGQPKSLLFPFHPLLFHLRGTPRKPPCVVRD